MINHNEVPMPSTKDEVKAKEGELNESELENISGGAINAFLAFSAENSSSNSTPNTNTFEIGSFGFGTIPLKPKNPQS